MSSLVVREFENTLVNFINQSPLPIEVKRLVVNDVVHQLDKEASKVIIAELSEREQAQVSKESEVEADGN